MATPGTQAQQRQLQQQLGELSSRSTFKHLQDKTGGLNRLMHWLVILAARQRQLQQVPGPVR